MTYEYNSHTLYIDNDTKNKNDNRYIVYESTNMNNEPTSKHIIVYIHVHVHVQ